ncbi:G-type lectin S-receptor-like serine/threonine-protein kinase [Abeliophyllum distichum]|uniref:G-type lectin S-receptor-like serine/threonine-protein kinase n=1 Tax=Abeliophyllum distichum TaxID=126358 RepID=A0ABD1QW52_9LAMI
MEGSTRIAFLSSLFFSFLFICDAVDTITVNTSLTDGNYVVSSGGTFQMGFFSPDNSNNRFLGIWYKQISVRTVVWVANRDTPFNDTSGALKLTEKGNLILVNSTNDVVIWSSNSTSVSTSPVVELLDSGNLVVRGTSDGNYIWQSFDNPT